MKDGAVMEERGGWERPGFFLPHGSAEIKSCAITDDYSDLEKLNSTYNEYLKGYHTFGFFDHHNLVRGNENY